MQLTQYTDYTLRVLMYLAQTPERNVTITEIANFYQISRNHLVKIIHALAKQGLLHSMRGKHGGVRLAVLPEKIQLGALIRKTENHFALVECLHPTASSLAVASSCTLTRQCGLKSIFNQALLAFFQVLDQYTLADALTKTNFPWIDKIDSSMIAIYEEVK